MLPPLAKVLRLAAVVDPAAVRRMLCEMHARLDALLLTGIPSHAHAAAAPPTPLLARAPSAPPGVAPFRDALDERFAAILAHVR